MRLGPGGVGQTRIAGGAQDTQTDSMTSDSFARYALTIDGSCLLWAGVLLGRFVWSCKLRLL